MTPFDAVSKHEIFAEAVGTFSLDDWIRRRSVSSRALKIKAVNRRLRSCKVGLSFRVTRTPMKPSIDAELVYNFTQDAQIIANLQASRTSDQTILSESLDIQPQAQNSL
jgi:hypothetical protein